MSAVTPPSTLAIRVETKARGQGSKRHVGGGRMIEQSKHLPEFRRLIATAARAEATRIGWEMLPRSAPARVHVTVLVKRPRVHYRSGRYADQLRPGAPGFWAVTTPDGDKVKRAILDALTAAGIWADDRQGVSLHIDRMWAESDVVQVVVERLPERGWVA